MKQWRVIWAVALLLVALWPTGGSRSLAVKGINFLADPLHRLPVLPPPLPLGLGDDADAVILHDAQEALYYDFYERSRTNRIRIRFRDWRDPLDPTTERQLLIALAVLGGLMVWRVDGSAGSGSGDVTDE